MNSAFTINEITYPRSDALTSLEQKARDLRGRNLTAEESLKGDGLTGATVALSFNKNGKYARADGDL